MKVSRVLKLFRAYSSKFTKPLKPKIFFPFIHYCLINVGPDYVKDMWNFICPELLSAIKGDPENEVVGDLFYSLAKVSFSEFTLFLFSFQAPVLCLMLS